MFNCSKPALQPVLWVTPIKQTLHEQHFHVFKIGWQSVSDSISLQLSQISCLEHTAGCLGDDWGTQTFYAPAMAGWVAAV